MFGVYFKDLVVYANVVVLAQSLVPPLPSLPVQVAVGEFVDVLCRAPVAEKQDLGAALSVMAGPGGAAIEALVRRILFKNSDHFRQVVSHVFDVGREEAHGVIDFGAQQEDHNLLLSGLLVEIAILVGKLGRDPVQNGVFKIRILLPAIRDGHARLPDGRPGSKAMEEGRRIEGQRGQSAIVLGPPTKSTSTL